MRVLFVGAGYVGSSLAPQLVAAGHDVFGLRRSARELPAGVVPIRADITEETTLRNAVTEATQGEIDCVLFGVAPSARTGAEYEAVYSRGVKNVLHLASHARFLLISSTAVYAESLTPLDEDSECLSTSETAAAIRTGEAMVLAHQPGGVVLRASGIYGPGRTRTIETLLASPPSGAARNELTNRIHRDDLGRALLHFLLRPQLSGVYNATDGHTSTLGEVSDFLESEPLPARLTHLRETRSPVAPSRTRTERASKRLLNQKLTATGFSFLYPTFREGYRALFALEEEQERASQNSEI